MKSMITPGIKSIPKDFKREGKLFKWQRQLFCNMHALNFWLFYLHTKLKLLSAPGFSIWKICPALKTKQKMFTIEVPKKKILPYQSQTKKLKYHPDSSLRFLFPFISSHQVVSVLLPKYFQIICSSPLPTGQSSLFSLFNFYNSLLDDLFLPLSSLLHLHKAAHMIFLI